MPQANITNHPQILNSPASTQQRSMSTRIPPSAARTVYQTANPTLPQRQPHWAKGSVFCSAADGFALNSAVKQFPHLGLKEWTYVQEQ